MHKENTIINHLIKEEIFICQIRREVEHCLYLSTVTSMCWETVQSSVFSSAVILKVSSVNVMFSMRPKDCVYVYVYVYVCLARLETNLSAEVS